MGGEEQSLPGGSAALLELIEEHRAALRFDFRRYFGVSLDDVGLTVPFGEAIDLVNELQREWGSHLSAAIAEWSFPATYGEIVGAMHLETVLNQFRKEGSKPSTVLMPWPDKSAAPKVSPEEFAELSRQLEARSAFGSA